MAKEKASKPDDEHRYTILATSAISGVLNHQSNTRKWYKSIDDAVEDAALIIEGQANCKELVIVEAARLVKRKPTIEVDIINYVR